jgi:hypothetical protein
MLGTTCAIHRTISQNHFSAIKGFRIFSRGAGLHSPQPQKGPKGIFREPVFLYLSFENLEDMLNLPAAHRLGQLHKKVGLSQITIIFWNFVFQNEFASKGIPGQIGDQTMVLVPIVAIMSQNDVR